MDIATKCQTHNAIKSHSKKEYIVRLLFDEKGYEIGYESTGEIVRCKDCVYWKYRATYEGDEWGACLFLEDVEHWTEDTAFCSYGERSDNANTD